MLYAYHDIFTLLVTRQGVEVVFLSLRKRLLLAKLEALAVASILCKKMSAFLKECFWEYEWSTNSPINCQFPVDFPQGAALSPLLFIIFINDLLVSITSSCYMFVDSVKSICPTNIVNTQIKDLKQTFPRTSVWDTSLNVTRYQNLLIGPRPILPLVFAEWYWRLTNSDIRPTNCWSGSHYQLQI